MKTVPIPKNFSLSKKKLDFALLPIEHDAVEYDKIEFNSCEEELPGWHESVVEARYQAWKEGKITSGNAEEVFKDLLAKASKKRSL